MRYFIHSEPGYQHVNEDCVEVRGIKGSAEMLLCALADGQGGTSGGGAAARVAVQSTLELAAAFAPDALLNERTWRGIVQEADANVEAASGVGYTTLVCIAVTEKQVVGASCGDSAALLLADGQIRILTNRQTKNPPVGSAVAQAVSFCAALAGDWKLLVMSDGVWKYVGWERIEVLALQHGGGELISELRQSAASGWGGKLPDDFTVALFER